jgi:hypothetical protein
MSKQGKVDGITKTETNPEKKEFAGDGIEGEKGGGEGLNQEGAQDEADKAAAERLAAEQAEADKVEPEEKSIVTGEDFLAMKRREGHQV